MLLVLWHYISIQFTKRSIFLVLKKPKKKPKKPPKNNNNNNPPKNPAKNQNQNTIYSQEVSFYH